MNFKWLLSIVLFLAPIAVQAQIEKVNDDIWQGRASFYHNKFNGRPTASGDIFSNDKLTAANNFLPLGTYVRVTNISNGESVIVLINDRMAKNNKRLIDLSHAAAKELKFVSKGLTRVEIEVIPEPEPVSMSTWFPALQVP